MTFGMLALLVLSLAAGLFLLSQCRRPRGWPGRLFLRIMNTRHFALTQWGLSHVSIGKQFTILDIGCGGGRTLRTLAQAAPEGKSFGIDYSETSVEATRRLNRDLVQSGRVSVELGSVSRLPFPDGTFDLVSAVETHYYWPHLDADLREILRVLKPDGTLVVIAETLTPEREDKGTSDPMTTRLGARCLSVRQHREVLSAAGFSEVAIYEEANRKWLCGVARKPHAVTACQAADPVLGNISSRLPQATNHSSID